MGFQQLTDAMSISGIYLALAVGFLIAAEGGYRLGAWWQMRTNEEKEGPTPMLVGSLLATMGFLLAITTGMATDRFDARRALILEEANSIGTAYLRAGYLPSEVSAATRAHLRDYLALRIATEDAQDLRRRIDQSVELHNRLWAMAESLGREFPDSKILALYIESLNQLIDVHQARVTVGIYGRVPAAILLLLVCGAMLTMLMVGYNSGLNHRRSPVASVVLIIVLGAVLTLVFDLDRSRGGSLQASQQPYIDLEQQIDADRLERSDE